MIGYREFKSKFQEIIAATDFSVNQELGMDMPNEVVTPWKDYSGATITAGTMVSYNGYNYIAITDIQCIEEYAPTLATNNWQMFQGKYGFQWMSGEYSKVGYTRYWNDVLYVAIQDPGANIYSPDLIPAIWEEV